MKKIFITGESGVIPKHLAEIIKKSNEYELVEYPDSIKTHNSFKIRKNELDFTSKIFENAISTDRPDLIIHSGAFVGTDFCQDSRDKACISNVFGTKNIVDVCNKHDIDLLYLSTTAIFDTQDYSLSKPITEKTKINPQTFYGITKYAGELTVKNECRTAWNVVRPVFGFSEYPHDLHSALTKYIYASYTDSELEILLDKNIKKSYTHAKNIAQAIFNIIKADTRKECFNIGKNHTDSLNWFEMFEIFNQFGINTETTKIKFDKTKDYLHYHNIDNSKVSEYFNDDTFVDDVKNVIESVKRNFNVTPYWI